MNCKLFRCVVNVRYTHSSFYTKYIVVRACISIYIWLCVNMYTTRVVCCVYTDTCVALEIHLWKTFYLLTVSKEIFLKEIIV